MKNRLRSRELDAKHNRIDIDEYTIYVVIAGCYVGYWGDGCENACQETCADACDHRTGRCVTRTTATATETLTTTTATTTPTTDRLAKATLPPPPSPTRKAMAAQARRPSVVVVVGGTDGVRAMRLESQNAETTGPSTQMATTAVTTSLPPGKMVSTVDVTVYKFDELIKKLIWISAMTVVAIAMVFVIMFVVFFNCYGAPKTPHDRNRSTASADDAAIHGNQLLFLYSFIYLSNVINNFFLRFLCSLLNEDMGWFFFFFYFLLKI